MGIRENVMYGTGATEGDGTGIEASGDGGELSYYRGCVAKL